MLIVPIDRARFFHNRRKLRPVCVVTSFTRFNGNGLTMSDGLSGLSDARCNKFTGGKFDEISFISLG